MKQGWERKKLGTVCEIMNGGTPKTGFTEYWGGTHCWITPAEMGKRLNPYVGDTERKITDLGLRNSSAQILPSNSVILSSRAPIGHLVINTKPMATNQGCKGLIPRGQLQYKFLYYYLSSIVDLLNSLGTGATFRELSGGKLKEVTIPFPPLPEQQRIVAILNEAFAAIAKAKANAEQNLKNAKELFESYLQSVFENKGEGWEEKTLGEIAFVKSGGTPLRHKTEYWEGNIAWYSSGELNNLYTIKPERHINDLAIENSNAKVFPKGSLLIGMYDTAALKMSILDRDAAFNQAIAGVKPNPDIDLYFILHSINSIKPDLLNLRRGVRQKNLSLEKIKNIPVFLPSLKAQQAIVQKLDALSAETKRLETIYRRKIEDLEEFKKSVLDKAFKGEL